MLASLRQQAEAAASAAQEASSRLASEATRLSNVNGLNVNALSLFPEDEPSARSSEAGQEQTERAGTVTPLATFALEEDDFSPPHRSAFAPLPTEPIPTGPQAAGRPSLDTLCEQQRRAIDAGQERVSALMDELKTTKLKALKKMRAQEETIAGLERSLQQQRSANSSLQLELGSLRRTAREQQQQQLGARGDGDGDGGGGGTPAPNPVATATSTPNEPLATAHCHGSGGGGSSGGRLSGGGLSARRLQMMSSKVRARSAMHGAHATLPASWRRAHGTEHTWH